MRVAGIHDLNTFTLPFRCLLGPIIICEINPPATPALSPLVSGVVVRRLCTGIAVIKMFNTFGIAIEVEAMLG